jgi:UDP-N-acetylmuramate dehydrogenase
MKMTLALSRGMQDVSVMTDNAIISTDLTNALDALALRLDPAHVHRAEPLAPYTTFRIGGPADLLYNATSADALATAISHARGLGVPWFVMGLGANILVADKGFRGIVIRNMATAHAIDADGRLHAESGAIMRDLVLDSARQGWSGLEHYVGIPSTVGGALWQNLHFLAPAPERERTMFISEVFESCEILAESGERRIVDASYINFGYDDTVFHHTRDIVLQAAFKLERGETATLHRILQENLAWRGARRWCRPTCRSVRAERIPGWGRSHLQHARQHHGESGRCDRRRRAGVDCTCPASRRQQVRTCAGARNYLCRRVRRRARGKTMIAHASKL